MLKEFKQFIMRGSVIDLVVGIIIGGAFGKIVSSLVDDIIMPPIGLILGKVDFSSHFIALMAQSCIPGGFRNSRSPTWNYGLFINTLINLQKPAPVTALATKDCPYCQTAISI